MKKRVVQSLGAVQGRTKPKGDNVSFWFSEDVTRWYGKNREKKPEKKGDG